MNERFIEKCPLKADTKTKLQNLDLLALKSPKMTLSLSVEITKIFDIEMFKRRIFLKTFIDIFTLAHYHVKIIVFMVSNHHVTPRTPFLDP